MPANTCTCTRGEWFCRAHGAYVPVSMIDGQAADRANSTASICVWRQDKNESFLLHTLQTVMHTQCIHIPVQCRNQGKRLVIVLRCDCCSLLCVFSVFPFLFLNSTSKRGSINQPGYWSLENHRHSVNI